MNRPKSLPTRTWPYGTVKPVRVIAVENTSRYTVYACEAQDDGGAFIIVRRLDDAAATVPSLGDVGTITFRPGGPFGGYWDFRRDGS